MKEPRSGVVRVEDIQLGERSRKLYLRVEELAGDILERGLMHPIVVAEIEGESGYVLVAGGRRLQAIKVLDWKEVRATIYPPLNDYELRAAELAENINREDLTFGERAVLTREVHRLFEEQFGEERGSGGGHSLSDTGRILGISREKARLDIALADALEVLPELAKCKNATEAMKKYRRIEDDLIKAEISSRAEDYLKNDKDEKLKRTLINNYHVGDFFEGAKKLPANSFHCIEIDPPYAIDLHDIKKGSDTNLANYNEISKDNYAAFIDRVIKESHRLLMDTGWLILWFGIVPWFDLIQKTLEKHGFITTVPAIWVKEIGQTHWPEFRLASTYEPFFYARKGDAIIIKQGRVNTFTYPGVLPDRKIHPTERPIEMIQDVLSVFTPPFGRVLVPFGGSGNTLLACANLGCSATCWDLSKEYKDAFTVRVLESPYAKYCSR